MDWNETADEDQDGTAEPGPTRGSFHATRLERLRSLSVIFRAAKL